jgi:hypothetical protein
MIVDSLTLIQEAGSRRQEAVKNALAFSSSSSEG